MLPTHHSGSGGTRTTTEIVATAKPMPATPITSPVAKTPNGRPMYRSIKTFQIKDKQGDAIKSYSSNNNEQQQQHPHQQHQETTLKQKQQPAPTTLKSVLNPVELPKNFSANNTINLNLNYLLNMEQKRPHNTTTPIPTTTTNTDNIINNNKTTTTSILTSTMTTKNMKIAEKCAINLNSFAGIIQKTTTAATTMPTKNKINDDNEKDNDDDDDNKKMKPQQRPSPKQSKYTHKSTPHNNANASSSNEQQQFHQQSQQQQYHLQQQHHHHNTLCHDTDTMTMKTKRSRISSSPPPLNGRDVELNTTSNVTGITNSKRQQTPQSSPSSTSPVTTTAKASKRNASPSKRFELEI